MSLNRITCPDCGAGLTSKAGFVPGRQVTCPKCEAAFKVSAPYEVEEEEPSPSAARDAGAKRPARVVAAVRDDDDDDDRPRKKKKKKRRDDDDDDDSTYRSSWVRYAILGVLVTVMLVLGFFLIQKMQREKEDAQPKPNGGDGAGNNGPLKGPPAPPAVRLPPGQGGPQPGVAVSGPGGPQPPPPKQAAGGNPFGGSDLTTVQQQQLTAGLVKRLTGTWEGTAPDGAKHRVEYRADMTFSHTVEGGSGTSQGSYSVAGLVGAKVLKLTRPLGSRTVVRVTFEEDELVHDTATPGESVVLRKK